MMKLTLKNINILFFITIILGCKNKTELTSENLLDGNSIKQIALSKSDSILKDIFTPEIFEKHIKWNEKKSYINCYDSESIFRYYSEDLDCISDIYGFPYSIVIQKDTIYKFSMSGNKKMRFYSNIHKGEYVLRAYRNLLENKFNIDYYKAKEISSKKGYNTDKYALKLDLSFNGDKENPDDYHWVTRPLFEMKSDTSYILLHINSESGETEEITRHYTSLH